MDLAELTGISRVQTKRHAQPQGGLPDSAICSPSEQQTWVQGSLFIIFLCLLDTFYSLANNNHGEQTISTIEEWWGPKFTGADLSGKVLKLWDCLCARGCICFQTRCWKGISPNSWIHAPRSYGRGLLGWSILMSKGCWLWSPVSNSQTSHLVLGHLPFPIFFPPKRNPVAELHGRTYGH